MDPELQKYLKLLAKIAIFVLSLVSIYLLFSYVIPMLGKILAYIPVLFLPFIIAVLLAVIIEPVVIVFETRLRLKRNWAVVFSLMTVVGGFVLIVSSLISMIIKDLTILYPRIASYSDQVITGFMNTISDFRLLYLQMDLPPQVQNAIQENMQGGIETLKEIINGSLDILMQVFAKLPSIFILIIIATVATFFIIKDRAVLSRFVLHLLPGDARSATRRVFSELFRALTGFLKAYSILITITAILTIVSLKILGVKYILTIGILVGLLDILPVLGPGTLFIPWIIWQFIIGKTSMAIGLTIVYIIISVTRQFLEPKIVGDNIGLHPLATLVSLYIGLQIAGLTGMILGPVLVVIFIASYRAGVFDKINWGQNR